MFILFRLSWLIRRLFAFCRLCALMGGKSCACLSAIRSTSLLAWPLPIASNNCHAASAFQDCTMWLIQSYSLIFQGLCLTALINCLFPTVLVGFMAMICFRYRVFQLTSANFDLYSNAIRYFKLLKQYVSALPPGLPKWAWSSLNNN